MMTCSVFPTTFCCCWFFSASGFCFVVIIFSSVAESCPTLCDTIDWSTIGFTVHHQLPQYTQTHVHWVSDAIEPFHSLITFSFCLQSFLAPRSFQMSQFFTSGGQSIRASVSASVLPMNIQDWFSLGLTGWISLQSKGLKILLWYHSLKASILWHSVFFIVQL